MIVCPALVVNVPARRFTMKIAHFALWTQQLDVQARFWVDFFAASINEKYLSQTPALPPILLLSTTRW